VTPFNGLIFNYRGFEYGGLSAEDVVVAAKNEPTISYQEFMDKLKSGNVEFVEFLAPDGDSAYATFMGNNKPIRIGEGTRCFRCSCLLFLFLLFFDD
jgi:hypothetical protein